MITEEQRKTIKDQNQEKARRQDNKQHCQKILEGIGRFDDNTASRAVWELFQNARDLSQHAHVRLVLENDRLVFSHNGNPFVYDTFTSLIKQVSSEEKEDPNAAGQFGTGFMTTHKFSRLIQIDGCMKVAEGEYALIAGFKLDRTANEIQDMIDAMVKQLKYADDLIDGPTTPEPALETTFTYFLDEAHYPAAKQGVDNAITLLPYVMTINDNIEQVEISGSCVDSPVVMVKEPAQCIDPDAHLYVVTITNQNGEPYHIYYLQSDDKKDTIILPLHSKVQAKQLGEAPRFFIFFPLLGTEDFGLNFIFHSARFFPEEPRNAIVLPEDNVDKQHKFNTNVAILNDMTAMLFAYLEKYADKIQDARYLADVSLDSHETSHELTRRFYEEIRNKYISEFQKLPFISLADERVSVSDNEKVCFLAPNIVEFLLTEEGIAYYDVVYNYASQVATLPQKEECLEWSRIVGGWNTDAIGRFVTVEDIVKSIKSENDKNSLLNFLDFLKTSKQLDNFPDAAIFPNREGDLKSRLYLRDASEITDILYQAAKPLISEDTARFVDNDFASIYTFTKYSRGDLKKSINEFISNQRDARQPFKDTLPAFLDYCSIFPVQNGNSTRNSSMPYICELFGHSYNEQFQPPLPDVEAGKEQNLYRTAFDELVEYTLKTIETKSQENVKWYDENRTLHFNILNALSSKERTTSYQTEAFLKYAIHPNQEGELRKVADLKVLAGVQDIPGVVKTNLYKIYQKTFNVSLGQKLVADEYAWMCAFDILQPKKLCDEIDATLRDDKYRNSVVVDIIDLLDIDCEGGNWRVWFENINTNKANIFLSRLQGAERASTYKFMKADAARKEKVLELMDNPDFEVLINKAQEFIQSNKERHIVFTHMLSIGKAIEDKLRAALDDKLLEVQCRREDEKMMVGDVQNGQDIIIRYKGEDIFYIEVKSKWNFDEPAHMSPNQMRQAVLTPDKYALCCVELTKYSSAEVESVTTQTILDNCYDHFEIGEKLSLLLKPIVEDDSDAETNVKIYDYRSNLNKGFFVATQYKGIEPLVNAILSKIQ